MSPNNLRKRLTILPIPVPFPPTSSLLSSSIIRQQELSTLKNTILVDGTNELISSLNSELTRYSIDPEISQVLESRRRARVENKNKLTHKLVCLSPCLILPRM
jgi:hypothetical protein